ncbi:MAG TPA: DinB family protein [Candidatus Dormibacteraeota bacterium]|nr:DinB family protein [Candidatus Dormibacteraeota bacterium]
MNEKERSALIEKYGDGYRAVEEALAGITDDELDRTAVAGEWTPRQIAHHLADAEMEGATRIRRLLAMENATILGYDEKAFAEHLPTDGPVEPSLQAMRWARATTGSLLKKMSDDDWRRAGTHTERGRYTTEDWLRMYAAHAHDHAAQIKRARGKG